MKILHTSDWHLGHQLYGHDRTEEQTSMLRQMAEIVERERPDVFLLCGDVFHVSQPSASIQRLFADHMLRIRDACPEMKIVATAGNHDSASRHEAFSSLWAACGVSAIGSVSTNPEDHIIEIGKKGFVVAFPYVNDRNLPSGYIQTALDTVAERNPGSLPVVMTAHTTLKGADYRGHEDVTEYTVGTIEGRDVAEMGEGYDYLALGHIHHAQYVHTGRHNVRYSGSPQAVSFDENYSHSVSIVNIEAHGETPLLSTVEIHNPWPLVTLPAEGAAPWEEALELLKEFQADLQAYLRLNVAVDGFLPVGALEAAHAAVKGKNCRFCRINAVRRETVLTERKSLTVDEMKKEQPFDVAGRYAEAAGVPFDEELQSLFREVEKLVSEDESL